MNRFSSAYILCSNPRSGTTLLCDLLAQTGVAGKPNSFFRQKSLAAWAQDWGVRDEVNCESLGFSQSYFSALKREGQADTACFGMRLMGADLEFACRWLATRHPSATTDKACFDAEFGAPQYVHLSRQDKLAEAVSYLRAEQTGLWHQNPDGTALEQIAPTQTDGYDAARITERLVMLRNFDLVWDQWFAAQEIVPHRISYEGLAADPIQTLAGILTALGHDPDLSKTTRPTVRKLADQISVDWMARYIREQDTNTL